MPELRFRLAKPSDAAAIVARVHSAYRGEASRRGWTTEADLLDGQRTDEEGVAELIARPRSAVWLALDGKDLVGCIHVEAEGPVAHFGLFAIAPARQAEGLGHALLEHAEAHARDTWGAAEMRMDVIVGRAELIGWYERRGYRLTGANAPFPYGDARFGLPRRDDLHFVGMAKPL